MLSLVHAGRSSILIIFLRVQLLGSTVTPILSMTIVRKLALLRRSYPVGSTRCGWSLVRLKRCWSTTHITGYFLVKGWSDYEFVQQPQTTQIPSWHRNGSIHKRLFPSGQQDTSASTLEPMHMTLCIGSQTWIESKWNISKHSIFTNKLYRGRAALKMPEQSATHKS